MKRRWRVKLSQVAIAPDSGLNWPVLGLVRNCVHTSVTVCCDMCVATCGMCRCSLKGPAGTGPMEPQDRLGLPSHSQASWRDPVPPAESWQVRLTFKSKPFHRATGGLRPASVRFLERGPGRKRDSEHRAASARACRRRGPRATRPQGLNFK